MTGNMPLSRLYLGPHKHSSYKIIGIFNITINMPLGLVVHGGRSETLTAHHHVHGAGYTLCDPSALSL